MVFAIIELADAHTLELARDYEATVITPGMPWEMLADARQVLWEALVRRAQRGEIVIQGVLDPVIGPVTLNPNALRGSTPDYVSDSLYAAGVTFYSVGVLPWQGQAVGMPPTAAAAPKGSGGRPLAHNWTRVAAEVVRIAHMEDLTNRRWLVAHMNEWCAKNLDTHPDESSVRKYVTSLCPADLPAE